MRDDTLHMMRRVNTTAKQKATFIHELVAFSLFVKAIRAAEWLSACNRSSCLFINQKWN